MRRCADNYGVPVEKSRPESAVLPPMSGARGGVTMVAIGGTRSADRELHGKAQIRLVKSISRVVTIAASSLRRIQTKWLTTCRAGRAWQTRGARIRPPRKDSEPCGNR